MTHFAPLLAVFSPDFTQLLRRLIKRKKFHIPINHYKSITWDKLQERT